MNKPINYFLLPIVYVLLAQIIILVSLIIFKENYHSIFDVIFSVCLAIYFGGGLLYVVQLLLKRRFKYALALILGLIIGIGVMAMLSGISFTLLPGNLSI
jgi:hypothetical protein